MQKIVFLCRNENIFSHRVFVDCHNRKWSFICSGFITLINAKKATKKIEQALDKKDPVSLTQGYESLADNYQSLNDFSKAVNSINGRQI
ncbi:hypothetical protein QW060_13885 [Myroides ceti]|uniref:Uncharacterized protein n=1 Tax=Paenimyroides ceti TaxID=395087 RepID=A0ABT8CUL0_9FLAO|nr:hypothetical protein [Paenimyroides ceti]MDN3708197.1 hypothetical protein [Paenimyroides ceti]